MTSVAMLHQHRANLGLEELDVLGLERRGGFRRRFGCAQSPAPLNRPSDDTSSGNEARPESHIVRTTEAKHDGHVD